MATHWLKAIESGRLRMRPPAFFIGEGFMSQLTHVLKALASFWFMTRKSVASMW